MMLTGRAGLRFGIEQAIGVIYSHTLPLYRRLSWMPDIIGEDGKDQTKYACASRR